MKFLSASAFLLMITMASPGSAAEISYSAILSTPSKYIGKNVTLKGAYVYHEAARESFTMDQNGTSIEVFYKDTTKGDKDLVAAQKANSKTPVTVNGTVQAYANRAGVYFINASSLAFENVVFVSSDDVLANIAKYSGKSATMQGVFVYSEPMRGSFTFNQNGNMVEAFYSDLSKPDKDLILAQKNNSKVPVTVTGVVQVFANKPNAFFLNASAVRFVD